MTSVPSVSYRGRAIGTFRHVSVFLMETAARFVPTTPEMEAKVVLGTHIWDFAQAADALGRRTFELRRPLHFMTPPSAAFRAVLDELASVEETGARFSRLYKGVLPALDAAYARYLEETDPILDGPSVSVIGRIRADLARVIRQGNDFAATSNPDEDGFAGRAREAAGSMIREEAE